jgi:hypothetical protein
VRTADPGHPPSHDGEKQYLYESRALLKLGETTVNHTWKESDGGCLAILRSGDERDLVTAILPVVGNSAVLVRSDRSWHAVQRVAQGSTKSRRSVTVTFYRPGSVSPMWPPGDTTPLHRYEGPYEEAPPRTLRTSWLGRSKRYS